MPCRHLDFGVLMRVGAYVPAVLSGDVVSTDGQQHAGNCSAYPEIQ